MEFEEYELRADPPRKIPTTLWWVLGLVVMMLFVGVSAWVGRHLPKSIGPAPSAPAIAGPTLPPNG